jgi:hypothetical protein
MNTDPKSSAPADGVHPAGPWTVHSIDKFLPSPTDRPEFCGEFASYEEAVAEGRRLLRECLELFFVPGMNARELFAAWDEFGEEVVVRPKPKDRLPFWSWAVVGELAVEMVAAAKAISAERETSVGEPGEPRHE